jgi:DNA-binding winged helix-turn-helix (wHTH) protein
MQMIYYFQQYRFDSEKLILSMDEQVLNLRNNEAKLLGFFLSHAQQVLSKEQILDAVWTDKVVGDQAVFQAISNLRQQFGDDAIRTFSKKGYQWQLVLNEPLTEPNERNERTERTERIERTEPIVATDADFASSNARNAVSAPLLRHRLKIGIFSAFILIVGFLLWSAPWQDQSFKERLVSSTTGNPKAEMKAMPVHLSLQFFQLNATGTAVEPATDLQQAFTAQLQKTSAYVLSEPDSSVTEVQLLTSPQTYLRSLPDNSAGTKILISGRLSHFAGKYQLAVLIQGKENQWLVHLQDQEMTALRQQLLQLLSRILPVKLLWEAKDRRLVSAQLQLLLNDSADDLNIHKALVSNLFKIGDLQAAQLRSEEMLRKAMQQQDHTQQIAALDIQARIALDEMKLAQAESILDRALAIAKKSQDAYLQAKILEKYFTIFYSRHQFEPLEENLLRALAFARSIRAQELEVDLMMSLTIASYKFSLKTKEIYYFGQAKSLFDQLGLAPENYARLEFFSATNSKDQQQVEKIYLKALQRFTPEQKNATKERIQEQLVKLYLTQIRHQQALSIFPEDDKASNAETLLKATILDHQNKNAEALLVAEKVFQSSNLSGEYQLALGASLILVKLYQSQSQTAQSQKYTDFIQKNASLQWRRQHATQMKALGIENRNSSMPIATYQ